MNRRGVGCQISMHRIWRGRLVLSSQFLRGAYITSRHPSFSISGPPSLILIHGLMSTKSLVFWERCQSWSKLFWLTGAPWWKPTKVIAHKMTLENEHLSSQIKAQLGCVSELNVMQCCWYESMLVKEPFGMETTFWLTANSEEIYDHICRGPRAV